MEYVVTLKNVYVSDIEDAGIRAVDLAKLSRRRFNVPLGFVLKAGALEAFVKHNNLEQKGAQYLANQDYESMQKEVQRGQIPPQIMDEIKEAYETLSVDPSSDASAIVKSGDEPFVSITPSPNYETGEDNYLGVYQNVRGLETLKEGIKMSWASLFSREAFDLRKEKGISEFFAGIILLKMPKSRYSATAKSYKGSDKIKVNTWFGFPDYGMGLQRDQFTVSKEHLKILGHEVREQAHKIERDEEENLQKVSMEGSGSKQSVDDKTVVEIARLTKKMATQLERDMAGYYTLDKENEIYLIMADRLGEAQEDLEVPSGDSKTESIPAPPSEDMQEKMLGEETEPSEKEEVPEPEETDEDLPEPELDDETDDEEPDEEKGRLDEIPLPEDDDEEMEPEDYPPLEDEINQAPEPPSFNETPDDEESDAFLKELEKAEAVMKKKMEAGDELPDPEEDVPEQDDYEDDETSRSDWEDDAPEPDDEAPEPEDRYEMDDDLEYEEKDDDDDDEWDYKPWGDDDDDHSDSDDDSDEPDYGDDDDQDDYDDSDEPEEEPDEKLEHIERLKELVDELDDVVQDGNTVELRHKLNELDSAIKQLRNHHS